MKIDENTKITLTVGQLKKLVKESGKEDSTAKKWKVVKFTGNNPFGAGSKVITVYSVVDKLGNCRYTSNVEKNAQKECDKLNGETKKSVNESSENSAEVIYNDKATPYSKVFAVSGSNLGSITLIGADSEEDLASVYVSEFGCAVDLANEFAKISWKLKRFESYGNICRVV